MLLANAPAPDATVRSAQPVTKVVFAPSSSTLSGSGVAVRRRIE